MVKLVGKLQKNILEYLRRTKEVLHVFGGEEELVVTGYTDASFQTDTNELEKFQQDTVAFGKG
jgi:hypothetical protein